LDKIIEAGFGGRPYQFFTHPTWRFIAISNKKIIKKISEIAFVKSRKLGAGANILLSAGSRIIAAAPVVILIYNSGDLAKLKYKYKAAYDNFGEIIPRAELSAISAAIQNMILAAEALGIGSCCWTRRFFARKKSIS